MNMNQTPNVIVSRKFVAQSAQMNHTTMPENIKKTAKPE